MSVIPRATNDVRQATLDISAPGMNGFMPIPYLFTSSANYVRQQVRAVLISAPLAMQYMTNQGYYLAALKSLIETRAQSIDGLTSSITWDYDGPAIGNAGEKLDAPIKANRAQSTPTFIWSETYGMAITRFWTDFGRLIVMDPDLQFAGIVAAPNYIGAGSPALLPEFQTFTTLFFEADPTMTTITNAWLCGNMMPKGAGDIIGKMEKGGSSEVPTVSIEFTAYTQTGEAVYNLAQSYLTSIKLQDLRPLNLVGITDKVDPAVDAITDGLAAEVPLNTIPLGA